MATKDKLVTLEDLNELKKYNDSEVSDLKSDLNYNHTAEPGYVLRATDSGHGNEWAMVGTPTDAQAETAINKWLDDHPEATTTVQDGAITKPKLNTTLKNAVNVVQFNILDYQGSTLNEKFDSMKNDFLPWQTKQIVIPPPDINNPACIKVGNDVKWKISAPLVFDNSCNCSEVYIYGELFPINPVNSIISIHDATTKPDNIVFATDIYIRGNRSSGNTIGNAIEILSGARILFNGNVYINDCNIGVLLGGANQTRPVYAIFGDIFIAFFDSVAVSASGITSFPVWFQADTIEMQCAQTQDINGVEIGDCVLNTEINEIRYNTDVAKSGYVTQNLNKVVSIAITTTPSGRIRIGGIHGNQATYALYIDNSTTDKLRNVIVGYVDVMGKNTTAIYARKCQGLTVFNVANNGNVNVKQCIYSRIYNATGIIDDTDAYCSINGIGLDTTTTILNVPSTANLRVGDVTVVKNANGTRAYLFDGSSNIPFDGQMFIPTTSTLPTPAWNLRGKMFKVNNDSGQDVIAVCIKYGGNSYKWFDLITNTVL